MAKQSSAVFVPAIHVDRQADAPLHRQVYESYRQAILSGQLRHGAKLPSTRELARELGLSRNTVMTAFEQLLAEGYLDGKIGSGTYVSGQVPEALQRPVRPPAVASPQLSLASDLLMHEHSPYTRGFGAFGLNLPALDQFPWAVWSRLTSSCSRRQTKDQLSYSGPKGWKPFREAIAAHLRTARNVRCEAEQVIVVSGSQQALCLALQVLLNPGDRVWMEDPGYQGAREAFLLQGLRECTVPVDSEGIMVSEGQRLYPDARCAYVTPSHQYPLGVTLSLQRRLELLRWANRNQAWILEDDYDSEYRYVSRPLSSLQGLAEQDRVIYLGTFSKVLFPSLRIGYLVVPPGLADRFAVVRRALDCFPPVLYQMILTDFLREGHFARHLRKMRSVYASRVEELKASVDRELSGRAHIEAADSGMHAVLFVSPEIDDVRLSAEAARRGVTARALSPAYRGGQSRKGLVLGFGGADLPRDSHRHCGSGSGIRRFGQSGPFRTGLNGCGASRAAVKS